MGDVLCCGSHQRNKKLSNSFKTQASLLNHWIFVHIWNDGKKFQSIYDKIIVCMYSTSKFSYSNSRNIFITSIRFNLVFNFDNELTFSDQLGAKDGENSKNSINQYIGLYSFYKLWTWAAQAYIQVEHYLMIHSGTWYAARHNYLFSKRIPTKQARKYSLKFWLL